MNNSWRSALHLSLGLAMLHLTAGVARTEELLDTLLADYRVRRGWGWGWGSGGGGRASVANSGVTRQSPFPCALTSRFDTSHSVPPRSVKIRGFVVVSVGLFRPTKGGTPS